jgi:hypothetical protein
VRREAANRVIIYCWYQRQCGAVGVHLGQCRHTGDGWGCAWASLHELPLRVTNATIKTTDEGVAMDAFDVLVDAQCTMSAMDVEIFLRDKLRL